MLGTVDLLPHTQVVTNSTPTNASSADLSQSGGNSPALPRLGTEPVDMKTEVKPDPPPPTTR
jgi:hypothetical protein